MAGGLLTWASIFIGGQVHDQLAAQKIVFPAADSPAVAGPEFAAMRRYGGQQLVTGAQAETYANHFIAVHLSEVGHGQTYAQVSTALQADPTDKKLQAESATLFQGNTLRGLLLNAYAFGTMARLAMIGAVVAFAAAGLLLVLAALGLGHARRAQDEPIMLHHEAEPVAA